MPIHDWTRVYAGLFHHFHQSYSIRIAEALNNGLLPRGMTALVEQRSGPMEADVLAVDMFPSRDRGRDSGGGVQTLEPPRTKYVTRSSKEIYAGKSNRIAVKHNLGQTVAVIEIVSPGNEDSKRAFREFIEKSLEFIQTGIHLLVVDLFPPSKRDPHGIHRAIWDEFDDQDPFEFPPDKDRTLASYDAGRDKVAFVEPIAVGDVMPDMPLYLSKGFYIHVPLNAAYEATWAVLPRDIQQLVLTGRMPENIDEAD